MKRLFVSFFVAVILLVGLGVAHSAVVYKLWLPDALNTGTATSLNGIHSGASGVPDQALAIVSLSGSTQVQFFKFQSSVTGPSNTTTHPYMIVPINRPTTGVWWELSGISPWITP